MLKKIVVFIIVITGICVGFVACTPTPPSIIMQRCFQSTVNIFPEDAPVHIETIEVLNNSFMFRCIIETKELKEFEPSRYDIGNVYFIAYTGNLSSDPFVIRGKYSVCSDNPTEDNPLFTQFLKDYHWGENYTDYEILYGSEKPTVLFEEEDTEVLNELAGKMAEKITEKQIGKTTEYVLGEIRSNSARGKYYYGDFNLKDMTMKFIRINITKETLQAYKDSGEVILSGVSSEDFDPYRYVEYADEIISNT